METNTLRPSRLIIHNIGIIPDADIQIGKPLLIFYGELMQGKSTILKAVGWVCGGEFPSDILRHGCKDAHIELQFGQHTHIRREFYLARDGKTVKTRAIEFIRDGRPVDKPAAAIEALLNPFTLDQDFLVRKNEKDRNRYFVELFGVDTTAIDGELTTLESEASALRSELKGYGEIDLTVYETVDTAALQLQRQKIVEAAQTARAKLEQELEAINTAYSEDVTLRNTAATAIAMHNNKVETAAGELATAQEQVKQLRLQLTQAEAKVNTLKLWLKDNPQKQAPSEVVPPDTAKLKERIKALYTPDTTEVDTALSNAAAANVKAEQYAKNQAREEERMAKANKLTAKEAAIKAKREEKLAKLTGINDSCTIEGLKFTADGEFSFQGTTASMLSTSQLMLLSKSLSDKYPPGLGIQLIDRGESLGSSIFKLIDRAKAEEKTVLATVVGERPAVVPEQVGVFVVENGKVSS